MQSRNFEVVLTGESVIDYCEWCERLKDCNYLLSATDLKKIIIYVQFPKVKKFHNSHDVKFNRCNSSSSIIEKLKSMDVLEEKGHCRNYPCKNDLITDISDYIDKAEDEICRKLIERENAMICSKFSNIDVFKNDLKIYYIHGSNIRDRIRKAFEIIGDNPYNKIYCIKKMWHVSGKRVDTCWFNEFNDLNVDSNCFLDLINKSIKGLNIPRSFTFNTWKTIIITSKYSPSKLYLSDSDINKKISDLLYKSITVINLDYLV